MVAKPLRAQHLKVKIIGETACADAEKAINEWLVKQSDKVIVYDLQHQLARSGMGSNNIYTVMITYSIATPEQVIVT